MNNFKKLIFEDYNKSCEDLATYLLGKILVRKVNNTEIKGKIVETECYLGGEDKASHSYNNKKTPRNEAMFMKPGTSYVYMTYGMYHCLNISSIEPGGAVLIRALEPISGMDEMNEFRSVKRKGILKKISDLCNGPSKLCISMDINKTNCNKCDLTQCEDFWIQDDSNEEPLEIVNSHRIGIESAGEEWAKKKLRFYIYNNSSVSKRDKIAEENTFLIHR